MADWRIHKRDEGCTRCGHEFEEGEAFFSILSLGPERLGREDHCSPCFRGGSIEDSDASGASDASDASESETPPEGAGPTDLIFWRTRRRPSKKRGLAVDFDAVEGLFMALDGREETRLAELRFLLSLLLMRKRRLKLLKVRRRESTELMILRRPRRTEELAVQVFDLTPERATELRGELEGIFEGAGNVELADPPARTDEAQGTDQSEAKAESTADSQSE